MTEIKTSETTIESNTSDIPVFGYELIREILLPSILGKETATILYWAGKDLARKFPLQSMDEIINFFAQAGWGKLVVKAEGKHELEVELSSSVITERLHRNEGSTTFKLEAGFLAQQMEKHKGVIAECYEHPKKRANKVLFTIKWDAKDMIE